MSTLLQSPSGGFGADGMEAVKAPTNEDLEGTAIPPAGAAAAEGALNLEGAPNLEAPDSRDTIATSPSRNNDNQIKNVPWASVQNGRDEGVIATIDDMKDGVYFLYPDWKTRQSKFWMLLLLAAVIATAGVVGQSTATVIGAMIVAPLMMPIQGLMLSSVLTNKNNWFMSLFMVLTGVGSVILIGFLFGLAVNDNLIEPKNNSEVSSRISPALTDLLAALATGCVGAISLVRKDIAGALPGVAISISLVPPLAVVGLMLSIRRPQDAVGAMLLFTTNFLCIMVMGIIILYVYGVHRMGHKKAARYTRTVFLVVFCALAFVTVPLYFSSQRITDEADAQACLEDYINIWGKDNGWRAQVIVTRVEGNNLTASATVIGPPPFPPLGNLTGEGVAESCPMVTVVEVGFFPAQIIEL